MSDLDSMTDKEVAEDLEKLNVKLSKKGELHAYEDAVMLQAIKRLRQTSPVQFNEKEIEELKRLVSRHGLSWSQRQQDYTEHPTQFAIYRILGLFQKWFPCQEYTGETGYCEKEADYVTNPNSDTAIKLFQKIAREAGIEDEDFSSIEGEKALALYFGERFRTIIEPTFRCKEHIKKLKEIAIKI